VLEALEALRELFGYDFKVSGNRVFVYPNTVQTRLFKINYLPGRRQGVSDIRVSSSSIVQQSGSSSSSGVSSSSSNGATQTTGKTSSATALEMSSVNMTSDADFWRDVKESLNSLLATNKGSSVTLNPGAGVIVVRATPAELRQVADYLKAVQVTIERQVMLEAKIVEVQLGDATQTGVNWSLFGGIKSGGNKFGGVGVAPGISLSNNGTLSTGSATISPGGGVVAEALGKGFYGLAVQGTNFTALLSFLETQGSVQVLSSPRIATINNQKAVLKVGTDELFLTNVTNNSTSTASGTTNSPSLTLQPFFSGISLDVTPQIDDKGVVMLHVHPSISVVSEKQKTFDLGGSQVLRLPLATSSINETDSIVRVMDGQIVAIGGLMQASGSKETSGLPGISEVPVVGNAFKYKQTNSYKRELVILIKPTVISDLGQGFSDAQPDTPLIRP
jgi:MSHA biogenesis protein MshL